MRTPKLTNINPASPACPEQRRRVILSIYAIGKNSPRIFACSAVRRIGQPDKKMQNEPNFAQRTSSIKYPESRIEQILSNEPNLPRGKITHLINEQQTMNNEQLSNEPNKNPILPAILSIYAIGCSLDGKYLGVLGALGGYKQKISNFGLGFNQSMKKMQNEPNLKITRINVNSFTAVNYDNLYSLENPKNEPNLRENEPNVQENKPNFDLAESGNYLQKSYLRLYWLDLISTFFLKGCGNESQKQR